MKLDSSRYDLADGLGAARLVARVLVADWGGPAALAAQRLIMRWQHKMILQFLAPLEALMRRLVLIMAAALKPSPRIERKARSRRTSAGHGCAGMSSEDFGDWGVSFRFAPTRAHGRTRARKTKPGLKKLPTTADARPLAERWEAVLRVLENPAPYAERLRRRLDRTSAFKIITAPCKPPGRANPLKAALDDAFAHGLTLIDAFGDTS